MCVCVVCVCGVCVWCVCGMCVVCVVCVVCVCEIERGDVQCRPTNDGSAADVEDDKSNRKGSFPIEQIQILLGLSDVLQ